MARYFPGPCKLQGFLAVEDCSKMGSDPSYPKVLFRVLCKCYDYDCLRVERNYNQAMRQRSHLARWGQCSAAWHQKMQGGTDHARSGHVSKTLLQISSDMLKGETVSFRESRLSARREQWQLYAGTTQRYQTKRFRGLLLLCGCFFLKWVICINIQFLPKLPSFHARSLDLSFLLLRHWQSTASHTAQNSSQQRRRPRHPFVVVGFPYWIAMFPSKQSV